MKSGLGILALACLFMSACCAPSPTPPPESLAGDSALYEQYTIGADVEDVFNGITAKVAECFAPDIEKEAQLQKELGTGAIYYYGNSRAASLVLQLKQTEEQETVIDVYATDLSKMAWPRLRESIQYGALGKAGCPRGDGSDDTLK